MKFSRLMRESKLFWPATIRVDDGVEAGSDGARFPQLIIAQEKAEAAQDKINEWHSLINWSINVGFHTIAKRALKNGSTIVHYKDIDQKVVVNHLKGTISSEYNSWPRSIKRSIEFDATS